MPQRPIHSEIFNALRNHPTFQRQSPPESYHTLPVPPLWQDGQPLFRNPDSAPGVHRRERYTGNADNSKSLLTSLFAQNILHCTTFQTNGQYPHVAERAAVMPKKKLNKTQRREERLRKARQWLTTYQGSPKKIVKHYRERFHLDINCAISDLQAIGVEFTQEYLDAVKRSEQARLEQRRMKRERRMMEQLPDSDDWFAFIAGYTSGGAAYGLTWEDVGIDQALPYDEKVQLYLSQINEPFYPDDELAEVIDEYL